MEISLYLPWSSKKQFTGTEPRHDTAWRINLPGHTGHTHTLWTHTHTTWTRHEHTHMNTWTHTHTIAVYCSSRVCASLKFFWLGGNLVCFYIPGCVCLFQDVFVYPRMCLFIPEYVNLVCSGFLANVSLVIQSCYDMFVRRHMTRYCSCSSHSVSLSTYTCYATRAVTIHQYVVILQYNILQYNSIYFNILIYCVL